MFIVSKILPVTNHRDQRVKVTCFRGSTIVPWDYALGVRENMVAATKNHMRVKHGEGLNFVHGGYHPDGKSFLVYAEWE